MFAYYDRQITPPDKTPAIHCHSPSHSPQRIASITLALNFECTSVTITVIVCIQNLARYTFTGILKQHTKDCCMQLLLCQWVCVSSRSDVQVIGEGLLWTVARWSTGVQGRGAGMHLERRSCCLRPVYQWGRWWCSAELSWSHSQVLTCECRAWEWG